MKENYTVSFVKNDVNQCRLVKAESKEQALAYFAEIEPDAEICGAALDQCNLERRGCPVETVPDGWTPAPAEAETADKPADILAAASAAIEKAPARSAWARGVKLYALELLENVEAHSLTAEQLRTPAAVRAAMMNGAENWIQFSRGGCSLVCDVDIAERLCAPAELRRCDGGKRRPNSREDWQSVQICALFEASHITARAISAAAAPAEDEQEQSAETFTVTFYSAVSRSMCIENFDDRFKAEKFARQMLEAVDYPCVIVSTLRGMKLIEETRFFK